MKTILILLTFLSLHAQQVVDDPARHIIGKEGQIFSLKIEPKKGRLDIRLVDAPLASIEPHRFKITAKVADFGKPLREIPLIEDNNQVRLSLPVAPKSVYEFEIHDNVSNKSETIRIHTKP